MSLKVLHIFGTMNRGGAEIRTVSLMPGMTKKGVVFDYCALSGQSGVLDNSIKALGGNVIFCKLDLKFIFRFIRLAKKYDVVHSHVAYVSGFIVLLAKLANVKIRVVHFRNTTDGVKKSTLRNIRNLILSFFIRKLSTHILGVCEGALVGFVGADWKNNKKCQVIYNGFELLPRTRKSDFWKDYIQDFDQQQVIINVGRMDRQKNHIRQLEIFKELHKLNRECHLVLIGKENIEAKKVLAAYVERYELKEYVHFLGLQSDVPSFLINADVMLFPSLWEGLPGAVIEALSMGVPVVASSLPGVLEIEKYIDGLVSLDLAENNQYWANTIATFLNQSPVRKDIVTSFLSSPFLLHENVEQLNVVYTQ